MEACKLAVRNSLFPWEMEPGRQFRGCRTRVCMRLYAAIPSPRWQLNCGPRRRSLSIWIKQAIRRRNGFLEGQPAKAVLGQWPVGKTEPIEKAYVW